MRRCCSSRPWGEGGASGIRNDVSVARRSLRHVGGLGQVDHFIPVATEQESAGDRLLCRLLVLLEVGVFRTVEHEQGWLGGRGGVETGLSVPGIAVAVPGI